MQNEQVNHPQHYGGKANQYEAIKVIEKYFQGYDFHLASALKYILRAEKKGNKIQDLNKALWYLKRIKPPKEEKFKHIILTPFVHICKANNVDKDLHYVVNNILLYHQTYYKAECVNDAITILENYLHRTVS